MRLDQNLGAGLACLELDELVKVIHREHELGIITENDETIGAHTP